MSQLYTSAFRKHMQTIYPASYKSTIERLNREHRVYRIVFKTADRSCSGSHGEACSPEASLRDGFLEGTIDEGLENKAAGHQPVETMGMTSSGLLMNMNPHTYSSLTPWILLHVSKPAIYINRKTEAINCSHGDMSTTSLNGHYCKT